MQDKDAWLNLIKRSSDARGVIFFKGEEITTEKIFSLLGNLGKLVVKVAQFERVILVLWGENLDSEAVTAKDWERLVKSATMGQYTYYWSPEETITLANIFRVFSCVTIPRLIANTPIAVIVIVGSNLSTEEPSKESSEKIITPA